MVKMGEIKERRQLTSIIFNPKKAIDEVKPDKLKGLVTYYRNRLEDILLENAYLKRKIQILDAKIEILQKGKTNNNYHNFKNLKIKDNRFYRREKQTNLNNSQEIKGEKQTFIY